MIFSIQKQLIFLLCIERVFSTQNFIPLFGRRNHHDNLTKRTTKEVAFQNRSFLSFADRPFFRSFCCAVDNTLHFRCWLLRLLMERQSAVPSLYLATLHRSSTWMEKTQNRTSNILDQKNSASSSNPASANSICDWAKLRFTGWNRGAGKSCWRAC